MPLSFTEHTGFKLANELDMQKTLTPAGNPN